MQGSLHTHELMRATFSSVARSIAFCTMLILSLPQVRVAILYAMVTVDPKVQSSFEAAALAKWPSGSL